MELRQGVRFRDVQSRAGRRDQDRVDGKASLPITKPATSQHLQRGSRLVRNSDVVDSRIVVRTW